jgi:[acyl-carrier-protein] S-malonyltransferase
VNTAAWLDAEPVPAAEVAAELDRLRAGPLAARLPRDGTADARQLRRWVAQRVVLRRLLERSAAAGGLAGDPGLPVRPDAAVLGTAAADVLATSAAARAVLAAVTAGVTVAEDEVRAWYQAQPDRYARPERWRVRQAFLPGDADPAGLAAALVLARPVELAPATLVPELRGAPAGPVRSRLGWHLLAVDAVLPAGPVPYASVRDGIAAALLDRRRQEVFGRWLDAEVAARVRLAPGFEHPADPRQPDATHRH